MSFLLDTDTCSAYLKRPGKLAHRFLQHAGGLYIPTLVLAELYTWAYRRSDPAPLLAVIEQDFLEDLQILDFNRLCAVEFGRLRGSLLSKGIVVNPVDLMIASVAIAHDLTLVTHNTRHFKVVPELQIEDWIEE